jgi:RND family efflux transporter MFP subunit
MNQPASRKIWILLPAALIVIGGAVALHFHRLHQAEDSPPAEASPWAIETGTVERARVAGRIENVATVEAANVILLTPQIQGTALYVGPRAGVAVKRGELLVKIDARSIASNLAALEQQRRAAQADADYASKQQTRIDAVLAEGGVSQAQADQARTAADAARAKAQSLSNQIDALRVQLGYAEIRAPQDAVVAQRLVEVGNTVAPGKPVYQLTAGHGSVVRVTLPAADVARVHVGDRLVLEQDGARLSLDVNRVAPAVNVAGLGTVEADAPAAPFGLPSGSTVAAEIQTSDTPESLVVPLAAVVGTGTEAHVLVFTPAVNAGEPGHLRRVPIKVLAEGTGGAAVEGALKPGERVAVGQTAVLTQIHDGDSALSTPTGAAR